MSDGLSKLKEAKGNLEGIEKDSLNIEMEMNRQTNVLERDNKKLKNIRDDLSESNSMITIMKRNIRKNKQICYLVFGLVSLALFIILYSKFYRNKN